MGAPWAAVDSAVFILLVAPTTGRQPVRTESFPSGVCLPLKRPLWDLGPCLTLSHVPRTWHRCWGGVA